ncbi:hypothetical protein [Flavihumibacter profundi]|uniref:hypothetical protein n=1 Tax=Flavihumibacter profundi TaxID=2716883 RepID=UPI001CC64E37|nr:hypothetical protein [Flavihumibacter profundi]MBZ5856775.1 hypothetical protein [Flavihumibacter profundi]
MSVKSFRISPVYFLLLVALFISCSKSGSDTPADPCAGVTITVSATTTNTTGPGTTTGSIAATGSGSTGLTYSLNNGAYQQSGTFSNLSAGSYTITAKTAAGCTGTGTFTVLNGDPCIGKTITVSASGNNSDKCTPSGKITVDAAGSTGFTYRLGSSGTYQADNSFLNVAPGDYTVYAKDGDGCEKTTTVTVAALPNGPLFAGVVSLINSKCTTCHVAGHSSGLDFTIECNIVAHKDQINTAAVINGNMPKGGPALTANEKKVITDWIGGGGKSSN